MKAAVRRLDGVVECSRGPTSFLQAPCAVDEKVENGKLGAVEERSEFPFFRAVFLNDPKVHR